jgi:hypothetical protein
MKIAVGENRVRVVFARSALEEFDSDPGLAPEIRQRKAN